MDYFTSDQHLGHYNVIKHCKRPFSSVEEMDSVLLQNINNLVKPNDRLAIVGDFAWWRCSPEQLKAYRDAIKCKNVYLVIGNHDQKCLKYLRELFVKTDYIMEVDSYTSTGEKVSLVLCHYAMRVWSRSHYGVRHIFAHSHGTLPDDPNSLSMDVGVDNIARLLAVDGVLKQEDYRPISIDEFEVYMSKKTWKPKDHHGRD